MFVIVCYDVCTTDKAGERRLKKIAEICKDFGVRVQYSVFECRIEERDWVALRGRLLETYASEVDSLRFYFLSEDDAKKTVHMGVDPPLDPTGPLIV